VRILNAPQADEKFNPRVFRPRGRRRQAVEADLLGHEVGQGAGVDVLEVEMGLDVGIKPRTITLSRQLPNDTKTYYCFSNREVELPEEIKTKLSIKNGDTNCWDSIHSASDSSISEEEMVIGILNHLEREYQSVLIVKERETGAIDALLKIGVFDRVCHAKGDTSRDTLLKLKRWTKKTSSAVARRKWPDAQDAGDIEVEFWQKFVVDGSSGPVDDGESDSHWTGQSY